MMRGELATVAPVVLVLTRTGGGLREQLLTKLLDQGIAFDISIGGKMNGTKRLESRQTVHANALIRSPLDLAKRLLGDSDADAVRDASPDYLDEVSVCLLV